MFWDRLEARLKALPGVEAAALIEGTYPDRGVNIESIRFPGRTEPQEGETPWNVDYLQMVGPHALTALGARLIRGRDIDERDTGNAPRAVVVNEAFVRRFFANEDPIGKEVTSFPERDATKDKPARIVGVVADLKNAGVDKPAGTELFMPRPQVATLMDSAVSVLRPVRRDPDAGCPRGDDSCSPPRGRRARSGRCRCTTSERSTT